MKRYRITFEVTVPDLHATAFEEDLRGRSGNPATTAYNVVTSKCSIASSITAVRVDTVPVMPEPVTLWEVA